MFTVKAERDPRDGSGVRNASLFEAARVRVVRAMRDEAVGPNPLFDIELYDANQYMIESLPIGNGLDHYCVAYIMNEHGKTVDRVIAE